MSGFIVLEDGRAYVGAKWAYDAVIRRIADALMETDEGRALSNWLRDEQVLVGGIGSVDLRELTPQNRRLFEAAARQAFASAARKGPEGWHRPDFYPGWIERFGHLIEMMNSVRRGEPPTAYNPHMIDVIPPTGERIGPGWTSPSGSEERGGDAHEPP